MSSFLLGKNSTVIFERLSKILCFLSQLIHFQKQTSLKPTFALDMCWIQLLFFFGGGGGEGGKEKGIIEIILEQS